MSPSMRRFLRLVGSDRRPIVLFFVLAVLQFIVIAPVPFLVKEVFDVALAEERLGLLIGLGLAILGLQALSSLFGLLSANWILKVSTGVVRRLREAVFDKLYALSIRYHETHPIGDVHDRIVHETERVELMTRNGFALALPAVIVATGIMGVLVFINWALFLITIAFFPLVFLVNRVARVVIRRSSRRVHGTVESFSASGFQTLRTMRQTRILGAEHVAREVQDVVLADAADAAWRHGVVLRGYLAVNRITVAVWVVVILLAGGAAVIDGRLTIGELFSFYAGLALARQPLDQVIAAVPVIVAGQEALRRVFELLDVDDPRPYSGTRRIDLDGRLSVERVTFGYDVDEPVLRDVSLEVRPGEVVALVGPNGSGKTTLSNLVVGFYAPDGGRLLMDGVAYDELDMRHLRRQIGVLTQDPVMVPGTIRENIEYGRPGITEDELQRAVEAAAAERVVAELDDGLDTRAYENGPLLSGGQLQRVALARALLGRPRLLILDEPSTHLDVEGIAGVLHGLRSFREPPAMIVITHDPAMAGMADRVCRFEHGCLSEERTR